MRKEKKMLADQMNWIDKWQTGHSLKVKFMQNK